MQVFASSIASWNDHGYEAGRYVATSVLAAFETPPSLLIACVSDQYNAPAEVVRGIRSINNTIPLIGSCAGEVITMAGTLQKGVGVLGIRDTGMHMRLALETGLQNQPAQMAERAMQQITSDLSTAQGDHTTVLMFASGGSTAVDAAVQATTPLLPPNTTLVGAAAGAERTSSNGSVFLHDDVVTDGVAWGLFRSSAPMGVGLGVGTEGDLLAAAEDAAQQAMTALGKSSPAAAFIAISGANASASDGTAAPEIERIRDSIGRPTPVVGMYNLSGIAPTAGASTLQPNTVLVYVIGQG